MCSKDGRDLLNTIHPSPKAAGHSYLTASKGVTRAYICSAQAELYNQRAADPLTDCLSPAIGGVLVPAKRKPMEIDAYMASIGQHTGNKARHKAARAFRGTEEDKWRHGGSTSTERKCNRFRIPWSAHGKVSRGKILITDCPDANDEKVVSQELGGGII